MKKDLIIVVVSVILSVIFYGALRNLSVDLEIEHDHNTNYTGRPCTMLQKIVDTTISRNCSVFLEENK